MLKSIYENFESFTSTVNDHPELPEQPEYPEGPEHPEGPEDPLGEPWYPIKEEQQPEEN